MIDFILRGHGAEGVQDKFNVGLSFRCGGFGSGSKNHKAQVLIGMFAGRKPGEHSTRSLRT